MTERIIEIAETAVHLRLENHCLVIDLPEQPQIRVPAAEIGCLILANPAITITGCLLAELGRVNAVVVITSDKFLPSSMLLPRRVIISKPSVLKLKPELPCHC